MRFIKLPSGRILNMDHIQIVSPIEPTATSMAGLSVRLADGLNISFHGEDAKVLLDYVEFEMTKGISALERVGVLSKDV